MTKAKKLRCDLIEATAATQVSRKTLHKDMIDQYREDLVDGAIFPPIDVFREPNTERYILADGFHRLYAHIHAEIEEIDVVVHEGGMQEALIHALGANMEHGFRPSRADKRAAVEFALKDPHIGSLTRQEIADICHVHKRTVQKIANEVAIADPAPDANGDTPGEPTAPSAEDVRPAAKPAPTQKEVERDEVRHACSLIRALPYGGEDSGDLGLDSSDIAALEYVATWATNAVLVARK